MTVTVEGIRVINIDKISYAEMKQRYVIVSQDWSYNRKGMVCPSYFSKVKYIDKDDASKEEYLGYHFHQEAIQKAKETAIEKGLDFIYVSLP